ncbi:uncharacterized protein BROUX77_002439 [Berkeleyomyces rouxiae]|uniref:uncharacterized protein n=1 Tax=Berkeleyomyces rouxiae TaxID=2035830 RepID=UPI003B7B64FB
MGSLVSLCLVYLVLPTAFAQLTTVTIHLQPTATLTEVVWALVTPLTTVFTPPCGAVIMETQMQSPECLVPGMFSVWKNGGFYSPGVCPSGYTTNCVRSETRQGELIPLRPGETMAMCVPQSWTCYGGLPTNLAFYITSNGVYTAPAIEIRWRETDSSILAAAASTTIDTTTSFASPTPAPTGTIPMTRTTLSISPTPTTATGVIITHSNSPKPPIETQEAEEEGYTLNNAELSGIIFGICVAIMGIVLLMWCVMRQWERSDSLSNNWPARHWNHRTSTRLYSPSLVFSPSPVQQRLAP